MLPSPPPLVFKLTNALVKLTAPQYGAPIAVSLKMALNLVVKVSAFLTPPHKELSYLHSVKTINKTTSAKARESVLSTPTSAAAVIPIAAEVLLFTRQTSTAHSALASLIKISAVQTNRNAARPTNAHTLASAKRPGPLKLDLEQTLRVKCANALAVNDDDVGLHIHL